MVRRCIALLAAVLLAGAPVSARAQEAAEVPEPEWVTLTSQAIRASGRHVEVAVREHVDAKTRVAGWMLDACLVEQSLPTTCLSLMTEAEPLVAGREKPGRTFVVRAVPTGQAAWVVSTRWSEAGIELEATRLDLRGLTGATTIVGAGGEPEVQVPADRPLVPVAATGWKSGFPRPEPACVPLSVDVHPGDTSVDIDVQPASRTCTGWRVRHEVNAGTWMAHPLPGYATPDLLEELGSTANAAGMRGEAAPTTIADHAFPGRESKRDGRRARPTGLVSFSRR